MATLVYTLYGGLLARSTSGSKEKESAEEKYLSAIKDVYLVLNFIYSLRHKAILDTEGM